MHDLENYFETQRVFRYPNSLLFWLHLILTLSILYGMAVLHHPLIVGGGLLYLGIFGYSISLHCKGESAKALLVTVGSVALGGFLLFGSCIVAFASWR